MGQHDPAAVLPGGMPPGFVESVLALPRGGVPVAGEVARALHAPLDLLIVRKIGAPGQPELAVAAFAEGNPPTVVIDESTSRLTDIDHARMEHEPAARALQSGELSSIQPSGSESSHRAEGAT